ncbi:MAG: DNA-processing protein DprA [Candidatus Paceibacterota bacterium]
MTIEIKKLKPKDFPERLKEINDPPKELYLRGTLPSPDSKWLCVVGSRKYTNYGQEACEKLISGLSGFPIVIVSGLALGIDGIAHRAALSAGLKTIAVPGSGLSPKVLYPASNLRLSEKILESGGALLSEFEPEFKATPWSFPQRNRIMAGLSDAVLIIEAEIKSGTLITSKMATEYNRDVLAVPGPIFSSTSEGPHMLIRLGATPITSSAQLLEALGFKAKNGEESGTVRNYSDCSPEELRIIELLKNPQTRDDLIQNLKLPASKVNTTLSILELKGLIREFMGEIHLT